MDKSPGKAMSPMETEAIRIRYQRRDETVAPDRYSLLNPEVWQSVHERQRAIIRLFVRRGLTHLRDLTLLEVGCGTGGNLLECLRLGFEPQNLAGIELLEDRVEKANRVLPLGLVMQGDATRLEAAVGSYDIVFQSVVFSSLLDDAFQRELATRMWSWVKPGGGVLWYDFVYNNPGNPDVRGVPLGQVRALFPLGRFTVRKITLAPPIARRVCRIHPRLYSVFQRLALPAHARPVLDSEGMTVPSTGYYSSAQTRWAS
jgi:SAM-dependent methyltransferase